MQNIIQDINVILQSVAVEGSCNNDNIAYSEAKLAQILQTDSSNSGKDKEKFIKAINAFLSADEAKKRKLLSFCLDFVDPTAQPKTITANGEEIQQHAFLDEDELTKLYNFVKRHSADSTFDKTVYSVIAKHGMEPPQVYKNAMMRRQDFSRVTEVGNTSVTRRMAWQIIIGLHCNMDEADEVLFSAGYIRRKSAFDLTMEYFIKQQNYDIMAINEVLYELGLKVFSCYKPVSDNQ